MTQPTSNRLTVAALLCFAAAFSAGKGFAQEKQQVSFKVPAEISKYVVSQNVEVKDLPNHIVRIYELHRTFPNASAPIINGLKIVEEWDSGTGDRIDGNGSDNGYSVYVMENGDKLFTRCEGHVAGIAGKGTDTLSGRITGGTGKLLGIQGTLRTVANFDLAAGSNETQTTIEYSIGK
jgi:hypothetical protein